MARRAGVLVGESFTALGDGYRRRIVGFLHARPHSVQEIADKLPISRPAVSRHLRVLQRAGLVEVHAQGTRRLYQLDVRGAVAMEAYLQELWGDLVPRLKLVAENVRPKAT